MNATDQKSLFDLHGRVAVVTGGSGLYGFPICKALARARGTVVIASRNLDKNRASAEVLRGEGLSVREAELDLASTKSIEAFFQLVLKRFGRIDILINNAVVRPVRDFWESTPDQWEASLRVNVTGVHWLTRLVADSMRGRQSGCIVNVSSIYGIVGPVFELYEGTSVTSPPDYAIHRGGILSYTRYLATLLAPHVRVNCLTLGGLGTDDEDPVFNKRYSLRCPAGRKASTEDVMGPVLFLASDASQYMTGQNLVVDGGWTAW